jgi:serine/threonine protein kinase
MKSLNVLLDKELRAKIADFGLATIKNETASQTSPTASKGQGTFQWMGNVFKKRADFFVFLHILIHPSIHVIHAAPELFKPQGVNSKASDVYAFGVVCWEIVAKSQPWKGRNPALIMNWVSQGIEQEREKERERGRDRETEREKERERERERNRERIESEIGREREREREK